MGGSTLMPSDLEIAREATLEDIATIAWKLALPADGLHPHGQHIAKVKWPCIEEHLDRPQGSLVLVTSVNPTPFGEGKTVTTIGLTQALNRIGRSARVWFVSPPWARSSASKEAPLVADAHKCCQWSRSTCISPAICTP